MIKRDETNRVVFHHSLAHKSDVEEIRSWHLERGFEDIGYHFVILKTGNTESGRDIKMVGAHASGKNADSIGICFEGDFRIETATERQYDAATALYHCLCRAYGKNLSIEFHRELTDENPCPGIGLDRGLLINSLSNGGI